MEEKSYFIQYRGATNNGDRHGWGLFIVFGIMDATERVCVCCSGESASCGDRYICAVAAVTIRSRVITKR